MFDTLSQFAAEWVLPVLFFWLVMCPFATNIQEWIASRLDMRAKTLKRSIRNMLGSAELTEKFYDHPLLKTVVFRTREPSRKYKVAWLNKYFPEKLKHLPSYINSRMFAQILLDWVITAGKNTSAATRPVGLAKLQKNIKATGVHYPQLAEVLEVLLLGSIETKSNPGEIFSSFQTSLQEWFENAMEETTLDYKRRVQAMLLTVGFVLALYSNFDPIAMTTQLWDSSHTADSENGAVSRLPIGWNITRIFGSGADNSTCRLFPAADQLFGIPLFESRRCLQPMSPSNQSNLILKLAGFLVGSLLISIGAQYVFDLWKNKIKT